MSWTAAARIARFYLEDISAAGSIHLAATDTPECCWRFLPWGRPWRWTDSDNRPCPGSSWPGLRPCAGVAVVWAPVKHQHCRTWTWLVLIWARRSQSAEEPRKHSGKRRMRHSCPPIVWPTNWEKFEIKIEVLRNRPGLTDFLDFFGGVGSGSETSSSLSSSSSLDCFLTFRLCLRPRLALPPFLLPPADFRPRPAVFIFLGF